MSRHNRNFFGAFQKYFYLTSADSQNELVDTVAHPETSDATITITINSRLLPFYD